MGKTAVLMSFYNNIYNSSPVFLQNGMISLYGYYWKNRRFGKGFSSELHSWRDRESLTAKEWKIYQTNELRKLLTHAVETVPFYKEKYAEFGFKKSDFLKFELHNLKDLPYLEKEDFRLYGDSKLLSTKRKKGKFYSSSGSTGKPTKVYMSKEFHRQWSAAYETRVRNWAGVDFTMARGMIGGRRVLPDASNTPPFYRYNMAEKQTYFSAYHISESNVENYLKGMIDNRVEYMVGYAMSNYFLADLIEKKQLKAPKLKAVITSSEKLTKQMRETIENVYKCKTFDGYSGVEACGLISENIHGDFLLSPDTGIMEVIDENGQEVDKGEEGEIVSTGLLNFDQPLIRYRIGDRIRKSEKEKSGGGIEMPMFDEISGRMEDVITSIDGKKMVRFHGVFIDINGLKLSQLIQKSHTFFVINLVVDLITYSKDSETIIRQRMKSQLGENISIEFQYLDDIPKTRGGKYRAVISEL